MKLIIGDKAPSFSLYNTQKQLVTLDSLAGKRVVMLFFPAAFTSTCTRELCSVRDELVWYNNVNATVFGISTDMVYTLIRFREDQKLNFELLSDYNKEASESYGALYETFSFGMKGVSRRAAFVIDASGIIRYAELVEAAGELPDFVKIKQVLS